MIAIVHASEHYSIAGQTGHCRLSLRERDFERQPLRALEWFFVL
jgi:hypothetical protein